MSPTRPRRLPRPLVTLLLLALLVGVFLALPSPIDPAAYTPPAAPELVGPLAPNTTLRGAELLGKGQVVGPEDVAVDDQGRVYGACADGRIVRISFGPGGEERTETFVDTGGRPLGLAWDPAGRLIVADALEGLLAVSTDGTIEVLSTGVADLPFGFTDDLDVASDGSVYFSDASWRHGVGEYLYDLLEARPWGRLLRWGPVTGETESLLDELYFANGIALSQNEDFVLVNETYRYRIRRYWLKGPKAGTNDIFIDNLPGFPDGVSANRRGTFWVALFTVRNPLMDRLHPSPFVKRQMAKLPRFLWPKPAPYGLVMALDEQGRPVRTLHDPGGERVLQITSVEEVEGQLYLGNLTQDWIGRLPL